MGVTNSQMAVPCDTAETKVCERKYFRTTDTDVNQDGLLGILVEKNTD